MKSNYLFVSCVFLCLYLNYVKTNDCTNYKRSFERALTRKKRFLLFPPNAAILITPTLVKGLIMKYPRGFVSSFELDMYHMLPNTIEDVRPKIFGRKKTTPKPPKMMTTKKLNEHEIHDHDLEDHIYTHDHDHHRADHFVNKIQIPERWSMASRRSGYENFYPSKSNGTSYPGQGVWQTHPLYKQVVPWTPRRKSFWNNSRQIQSKFAGSRNRLIRNVDKEPISGTHRERRSIYNTLEGVGETIGFNVRACILRAICEAKHFLLPPGKSLIQDVIRILFTIPDTEEMDEDYVKSGRIPSSKDCKTIYSKECPISFISLALHREVSL